MSISSTETKVVLHDSFKVHSQNNMVNTPTEEDEAEREIKGIVRKPKNAETKRPKIQT